MRPQRILIVAITLALLGLSPIALVSSAGAEGASVAAQAKPERDLRVRGTEPRPNKFFLKGKIVGSDYSQRKVVVEKKRGKRWVKFSQEKSTNKSSFRIRVFGPGRNDRKVCYRIAIPGGEKFARTTSRKLCIVKV